MTQATLWVPPVLDGHVPGPVQLTRRRAEILDRICLGDSSADIAAELWLTENTVKTHRRRLFAQFATPNSTHLAALACSGQVEIRVAGER